MTNNQNENVTYLKTTKAIREKSDRIFSVVLADQSAYFTVDLNQLDTVANYVIKVTQDLYPNYQIPIHSRWRHFDAGGIPRLAKLAEKLANLSLIDQAKAKIDLVFISVLLDAGAGPDWQYQESETGLTFTRSEGLAVATFQMFCQGIFSAHPAFPYQVDAEGLTQLSFQSLSDGLQVSENNVLIGLGERLEMLKNLGKTLKEYPLLFADDDIRPGNLAIYFRDSRFSGLRTIKATEIFDAVMKVFSHIIPSGTVLDGVNLGDVWYWQSPDLESGLYVPFHKLAQWLTYSLIEPLAEIGLETIFLDELTGLAEYRNGGLLIDLGLIKAKDEQIFQQVHLPSSQIIIEWRSLTIILLDKIADKIREKLNLSAQELPLVKILQGGTWEAGRKIAQALRPDGMPPLRIISDGTIF